MAAPELLRDLGVVLLFQKARRHALQGVDKARKLDGRRILHEQVDVVVLTVRFQETCAEIVADLLEAVA
jgi:hypothetical protein